jgi:MFS family permease
MFQVQDATSFLAFSALYGAGSAAVWPSIMAHIGDTHMPERRGRTLNVLNIAQLIGLGVGTMAGVTLTDLISYQAAFIACMVFSGLALAFAYRGARDESQGSAAPIAEERRSLRGLLSSRVLFLAGIALLLSVGSTVQAPVVAEYSSDVLKTKMYMLGLMLIGPAAVAGFLAFKYGHLSDRFGRQLPLICGLAVATLCYFALSQTTNPILAVHLIVLAGLAYAVSIPAWGAAALDASEIGGRGLLMGLFATVQGFGGVLGQVVGGLSSEMWGPVAPFKMGGLLLMLALFLTVAHLYHTRRAAVSETSPV